MKKLLTIFAILISVVAMGQGITLQPSKGDRFTYYLNGDVWETDFSPQSEIRLQVFVSPEGFKAVWIDNRELKESIFKKLMLYIDTLSGIAVGGETYSESRKTGEQTLVSFDIYNRESDGSVPINGKQGNVDIFYLQSKIKIFFKHNQIK